MTKNQIEVIILEILSDISGLDTEELQEYKDINLFESGLLDSLSTARMLLQMQEKLNHEFRFNDFNIEELSTVSSMKDAFFILFHRQNDR